MQLRDISEFKPAAYNPRVSDSERLELVALSLRKLGFLLPVYATEKGEILSGHQRQMMAKEIGCTQWPVVILPEVEESRRKSVNILFNRATNDFDKYQTTDRIKLTETRDQVLKLAEKLEDRDPKSKSFFRCLNTQEVSTELLAKVNKGRWIQYARNVARSLRSQKISMPIVVDPENTVVNGIGRLEIALEKGDKTISVVYVTSEEAEFAGMLLNYLSMDFNIHERYADALRHNSFRRSRTTRKCLGLGFVFAVIGGSRSSKSWNFSKPENREVWIKKHGNTVLDFGAGHFTETEILREAGINCTPFEPYKLVGEDKPCIEASMPNIKDFLKAVAEKKYWTSIFISSVLNSVPFEDDRKHIVTILSALCTAHIRVFSVARGEKDYKRARGVRHGGTDANSIGFKLDYEDGIILGDFVKLPKVQKYHTQEGFYSLFSTAFENVKTGTCQNNVSAIAWGAKPIDKKKLRAALEFEFNLPYPDGRRMNMVKEAITAFEKRLEIKL